MKLKQISKRTLSILLTVLMVISTMVVGAVTTSASTTDTVISVNETSGKTIIVSFQSRSSNVRKYIDNSWYVNDDDTTTDIYSGSMDSTSVAAVYYKILLDKIEVDDANANKQIGFKVGLKSGYSTSLSNETTVSGFVNGKQAYIYNLNLGSTSASNDVSGLYDPLTLSSISYSSLTPGTETNLTVTPAYGLPVFVDGKYHGTTNTNSPTSSNYTLKVYEGTDATGTNIYTDTAAKGETFTVPWTPTADATQDLHFVLTDGIDTVEYTQKFNISTTAKNTITAQANPAEGGTVTINGGTVDVNNVDPAVGVAVTATPAAGYQFTGWTSENGNFTETEGVTKFMPNADGAVAVGNFSKITVSFTNGDTEALTYNLGETPVPLGVDATASDGTAVTYSTSCEDANVTIGSADTSAPTFTATAVGTYTVTTVATHSTVPSITATKTFTVTVTDVKTEDVNKKSGKTIVISYDKSTSNIRNNAHIWYEKGNDDKVIVNGDNSSAGNMTNVSGVTGLYYKDITNNITSTETGPIAFIAKSGTAWNTNQSKDTNVSGFANDGQAYIYKSSSSASDTSGLYDPLTLKSLTYSTSMSGGAETAITMTPADGLPVFLSARGSSSNYTLKVYAGTAAEGTPIFEGEAAKDSTFDVKWTPNTTDTTQSLFFVLTDGIDSVEYPMEFAVSLSAKNNISVSAQKTDDGQNYAAGGGNVTINGVEGPVSEVDPAVGVEVTATAAVGYQFTGWTSENGTITETNNVFTFTPNADNAVAVANFKKIHNITCTTDGNGKVESDKETCLAGESYTITLTPNEGYKLSTFTVNRETVTVTDNTYTAQATADVTAAAVFAKNDYTVSVDESIANGTVLPSAYSAQIGDVMTVTPQPADGYELSSVTVTDADGTDVTVTDNTFTMPAKNVTITAVFTAKTYNVTCSASENGTVSAGATAQCGSEVTLTVTPDTGYVLDTLTVTDADGVAVTVTNNKFTMPASDVTVTVTFKVSEDIVIYVACPSTWGTDGTWSGMTVTTAVSNNKATGTIYGKQGTASASTSIGLKYVNGSNRRISCITLPGDVDWSKGFYVGNKAGDWFNGGKFSSKPTYGCCYYFISENGALTECAATTISDPLFVEDTVEVGSAVNLKSTVTKKNTSTGELTAGGTSYKIYYVITNQNGNSETTADNATTWTPAKAGTYTISAVLHDDYTSFKADGTDTIIVTDSSVKNTLTVSNSLYTESKGTGTVSGSVLYVKKAGETEFTEYTNGTAEISNGDTFKFVLKAQPDQYSKITAFRQYELNEATGYYEYVALGDKDGSLVEETDGTWTFTSNEMTCNFFTDTITEYTINLYTDFGKPQATLNYTYTDREGKSKTLSVDVDLTNEEITAGYIPSVATVKENIPAVVKTPYNDFTWTVTENNTDTCTRGAYTANVTAVTTPAEIGTYVQIGDGTAVLHQEYKFNDLIELSAPATDNSGKQFVCWKQYDVDAAGAKIGSGSVFSYKNNIQARAAFNTCFQAVYGDPVTEPDYSASIQSPVYSRQQYTANGVDYDYVYSDFLVQFAAKDTEVFKNLAALGTDVKIGIVTEYDTNYTYDGTGTMTAPNQNDEALKSTIVSMLNSNETSGYNTTVTDYWCNLYDLTGSKDTLTNFGRMDYFIKSENNAENQGIVYYVYSYIAVNNGTSYDIYLSTPVVMNIYAEANA